MQLSTISCRIDKFEDGFWAVISRNALRKVRKTDNSTYQFLGNPAFCAGAQDRIGSPARSGTGTPPLRPHWLRAREHVKIT